MNMFVNSCLNSILGTLNSESGTVLVNSEANTMVESDLGTMVINESDEEDGTMKSMYLYIAGGDITPPTYVA